MCFEVTIETKSLSRRFVKISYDLRLILVEDSLSLKEQNRCEAEKTL